jgi:hypothetical protein
LLAGSFIDNAWTPGPLRHVAVTLRVPEYELPLSDTAPYPVEDISVEMGVSMVLALADPPTATLPAGQYAIRLTTPYPPYGVELATC